MTSKSKGPGGEGASEDKEAPDQKQMETVPNPPSFFYNDIEKWHAKFTKHIKDREYFKR